MRAAASDFFFNSWRLVPANVLWALGAVAVALAWVAWPPLALPLAVCLALPGVGMVRLSALIARGEPASFFDALDAWRDRLLRSLGVGTLVLIGAVVLATNVVGGLLSTSLFGWAIATLAGWGLLVGWCWFWCFWPIALDPKRDGRWCDAARLAGLLLLAHPWHMGRLGIALAALLLLSAVAILLLFMVSFAYATLVACRYVLPAADRLEASMAQATTAEPPDET